MRNRRTRLWGVIVSWCNIQITSGGASYSPLPDSLSSLLTSAAAKKRKEISSPDYEPIGDEGSVKQ